MSRDAIIASRSTPGAVRFGVLMLVIVAGDLVTLQDSEHGSQIGLRADVADDPEIRLNPVLLGQERLVRSRERRGDLHGVDRIDQSLTRSLGTHASSPRTLSGASGCKSCSAAPYCLSSLMVRSPGHPARAWSSCRGEASVPASTSAVFCHQPSPSIHAP